MRDIFCPKCGQWESDTDADLFCNRCEVAMQIYVEKPHIPFTVGTTFNFYMPRDISYTSPIDGTVIRSKQQRAQDLAKSGCIEYDPEMKTDYTRRIQQDEKNLEAKFEKSIEAEISKLPTKKRESLVTELQSGADLNIERLTA